MDEEKIYVRRNKSNVCDRIDVVIGTLENCKFDLEYSNKLKMPLTNFEEEYFKQAILRIDNSISFLNWLKTQVKEEITKEIPTKKTFWSRFKWKK